jgi:acyl-CoA reductase-like NAD-dependent aldehyde dehydrogenase
MGTDRILCHSTVASELMDVMRQQLEEATKGSENPPNVVSHASKTRLAQLILDATQQGAQIIAGSEAQSNIPGAGFAPTILSDVNKISRLHKEEAFGPLVTVATFETEDEAIELANDTEYGLHAAVFTKDLRKGLAIAKRLEVGAVHINSMTVHDESALPMGGVKGSGWGRFNAVEGMEEFLCRKAVTWDD